MGSIEPSRLSSTSDSQLVRVVHICSRARFWYSLGNSFSQSLLTK